MDPTSVQLLRVLVFKREPWLLLDLRSQAGSPVLFMSFFFFSSLSPCCNFEIKCQRTRHWLSYSKRHSEMLGAQPILLSGTLPEDFSDLLYFSIEPHLLDSPCTPVLGTALQLATPDLSGSLPFLHFIGAQALFLKPPTALSLLVSPLGLTSGLVFCRSLS